MPLASLKGDGPRVFLHTDRRELGRRSGCREIQAYIGERARLRCHQVRFPSTTSVPRLSFGNFRIFGAILGRGAERGGDGM